MSPSQAAPLPILEDEKNEPLIERRLPSGRSLLLRTDASGEEIELRSARGDLDLRIVLTDAGPMVTLRCARLEVESPEVAFRCHSFDVQTTGDLRLSSQREVSITADELRAKTERDIHLNGAFVRLNCTPDPPAPDLLAAAPEQVPAAAECLEHAHPTKPEP